MNRRRYFPARLTISRDGRFSGRSAIAWGLALVLWLLGFGQEVAAATDFYVAVDGSDANPGTSAEPVASVERARQLVRVAREAGNRGDVTVLIRGGEYWLDAPLEFDADDSAPAGSSTTYTAASGEQVRLSGGQQITGWRREGSLLVVNLPAVREGTWRFRELFVNGRRAPRARLPNEGYFRVVEPGSDQRTSLQYEPGQLADWPDVERAELVFFHDWCTSHVRLKRVDSAMQTVFLAAPIGRAMPHYAIGHFEPHPRYYVENSRAFLDEPGEWYLDQATGQLSYWPRAGEAPESLTAIAPRQERLLSVTGQRTTCRFATGLHFEGITFAHCGWQLPAEGLATGQAAVYDDRSRRAAKPPQAFIPSAVTFDLAQNCVIENCRFEHLGGSGVAFRETCLHNRFENNVVSDVAGNGLSMGENSSRQRRPHCPAELSLPNALSRGNLVRGNLIESCGALYPSGVGIWVGIAAETIIADNEIRNLPYSGIAIGWAWRDGDTGCRENSIRGNEIHHVLQVLSDGGAIYTLGNQPGSEIVGNRIHHIPPNPGRAENNGIFFDEASAYLKVANNEISQVAKSPLRFHRAHDIEISGNRLVCHPGVEPWRFQGCQASMMKIGDNEIREQADRVWRNVEVSPE